MSSLTHLLSSDASFSAGLDPLATGTSLVGAGGAGVLAALNAPS